MLTEKREVFYPFEYQEPYDYWLKQNQAHWLHTEIPMSSDLLDWDHNLTENERAVVGNILKGFTQVETLVNEYWGRKITRWFPKHEIIMMATSFSNMETIHAKAYNYLNESLGLEEYEAYLAEPTVAAKLNYVIDVPGKTKEQIAKSLAVFSAFTEGVALFSSFAVLMNFSRFNKLKGVGQIVAFSVRDESMHSEGGCWLFRKFIEENPEIWTDELKSSLYQAARDTIELEQNFINMAFAGGPIEGLDTFDLLEFIKHRANAKLSELTLKPLWEVDIQAVERMDWFEFFTMGEEHQDFFAQRVSSYSKGHMNWDPVYLFE